MAQLERSTLKAKVAAGADLQDEAKVDVDDVALVIKHDVAVVAVLGLSADDDSMSGGVQSLLSACQECALSSTKLSKNDLQARVKAASDVTLSFHAEAPAEFASLQTCRIAETLFRGAHLEQVTGDSISGFADDEVLARPLHFGAADWAEL